MMAANKSASASKKAAATAAGYQPRYSGQIDQMLYDIMSQQAGMANPYTAEGNQYSALANQMMGSASGMYGGDYSNYLNQYLTSAFNDPQSEIYQELLHNTQQGTRSAATARGLNTSPYGAGLENEAVRQMNLAWEQDRQNRQSTALQNYLAGQTGISGLGQNALSTATALESLKKGWSQQDISNMLNYIGKAQGNLGQAGAIQAAAGQQAAQPWSQLANSATQYAVNSLPQYNYYPQSSIDAAMYNVMKI
jgi:hypothetical protein